MLGILHLVPAVLLFAAGEETPKQAANSYVPINPKDVEFKVEMIGPNPLPYQAVRLRVTLKNASTKRINLVKTVDDIRSVYVKEPGGPSFREVDGSINILYRGRPWGGPTSREWRNRKAPIFLDPEEETSVSFAVAAQWHGKVKPLFPTAGTYTLKIVYGKRIVQTVEVEVQEEKDKTKGVARELKDDPEFVTALLCPVGRPSEGATAKAHMLLRLHPKSPYELYARFLVARFYAYKNEPEKVRENAAAAAAQLEKIMREEWAYQPNVLVLLRLMKRDALRQTDPILSKRYNDSLEWIEVVAEQVKLLPEQWRAFRKGKTPQEAKKVPSPPWPSSGPGQVTIEQLEKRWRDFHKSKTPPEAKKNPSPRGRPRDRGK